MIYININDLDLDNILLVEKSHEYLLFYGFAYKFPYGAKALYTIFDKVDGYIRKYDRRTYLGFFHPDERNETFFDRNRHLIVLKYNISNAYSYNRMRMKINLYDDLPPEKSINH